MCNIICDEQTIQDAFYSHVTKGKLTRSTTQLSLMVRESDGARERWYARAMVRKRWYESDGARERWREESDGTQASRPRRADARSQRKRNRAARSNGCGSIDPQPAMREAKGRRSAGERKRRCPRRLTVVNSRRHLQDKETRTEPERLTPQRRGGCGGGGGVLDSGGNGYGRRGDCGSEVGGLD